MGTGISHQGGVSKKKTDSLFIPCNSTSRFDYLELRWHSKNSLFRKSGLGFSEKVSNDNEEEEIHTNSEIPQSN